MTKQSIRSKTRQPWGGVLALCLLVGVSGCGLDEVTIPGFSGPSTYGISLVVTAEPDVLLADAVSVATVRGTVRGPDGQPIGGRAVFFAVTDENRNYVDLGTLQSSTAPVPFPAPQVTEVTANNGIAQVLYRVPERISVTAIQPVFIVARLVGDDATGIEPKSVQIELRPAEVRRFPDPGGAVTCAINVDPEVGPYPVRTTVRFFTASTGGIVQYFWDFGDGATDDKPDVQHAWRIPGSYSVTHVVTAGSGERASCSADVDIVP